MNCKLTKDDCAEIYEALNSAHAWSVQLRMGNHGERLARDWITIKKSDAQTISHALTDKHEDILRGACDSYPGESNEPGSHTFRLALKIGCILAAIGYLGENLAAERRESRPAENSDVAIEELRASILPTSTGRMPG